MQNLEEIQEKIFFESKNILETLAKINSKEELLTKQDLLAELTDRIAFLRILEKNKDSFIIETPSQNIENEEVKPFSESYNEPILEEPLFEEDVIEEEVIFTNELNEIGDEDLQEQEQLAIVNDEIQNQEAIEELNVETEIKSDENVYYEHENVSEKQEPVAEEKEIPLIVEQEEADYAERIAQKEKDFQELEERRRKIVEFNKEDVVHPPKQEQPVVEETQQQVAEKKFKLANIKGLKVVQQLFDEDPLEKEQENDVEVKADSGSILKTNIPTDFMEAEKKKPEFKLDLNDKVAFSQSLFKGNMEELNAAVDKLNSFDNLEDARQYLSEIYYQKDWRKVDEYAQRLWALVENKFL